MINEYSKLVRKEYKTRYSGVGRFSRELREKFDNTEKWYKHKPESLLENKMQKILRDFEIQTDQPLKARRIVK